MGAQLAHSHSDVSALDAIFNRHVTRHYLEKPIERLQVMHLLDAAVQAPSAMNQQPWSFAVAQGRHRLAEYSAQIKPQLLQEMTRDSPLNALRAQIERPDYNLFLDAPTLIIVLSHPPAANGNEDCCLAAQNLMLAAYALGLGTCPIGLARSWLNTTAAKVQLRIPASYTTVMPIVVGWPGPKSESHGRREPDVVSWIG